MASALVVIRVALFLHPVVNLLTPAVFAELLFVFVFHVLHLLLLRFPALKGFLPRREKNQETTVRYTFVQVWCD